jgi:hypothetical protein
MSAAGQWLTFGLNQRSEAEMASTPTDAAERQYIFRGFDESMTRLLGADFRLICGIAMSLLMIVGLVVLLALNPTRWLVVAIVLVEVAALGVIVAGLLGLMRDDVDDEGQLPAGSA